ncbi:MAG TPA: pyridoxamine 5'-phosphate oxidase [Gemmataceae bacterium]|nr:pyridoxamine 5'-phosphate oxidase [Gemmataceae bacterium]
MSIANLRREYGRHGLDEAEVLPDPIAQLRAWLDQAIATGLPDRNAAVVATVGATGQPSARVLLIKGLDDRGLIFFTNYESRKCRDLAANPRAAVTLFWPEVERQVRVEGETELAPPAESDRYFRSRPVESQLSAWASQQSEVINGGRPELERRLAAVATRFAGREVPRPPHWGGIILRPSAVEFWQGRPGRLHDRLLYTKEQSEWLIRRLAP